MIQVFGEGSAKVCREHVQKLNMMRGQSLAEKANYEFDEEIEGDSGEYDSYPPSKQDKRYDGNNLLALKQIYYLEY